MYTPKVIEKFKVVNIIDDFTDNKFLNGIPIYKRKYADKTIPVINCAGGKILTTQNLLKNEFDQVIHFSELLKFSELRLGDLRFNENFKNVFYLKRKNFEKILNCFHDEISKIQFNDILNFRKSYDLEYLSSFSDKQSEQYFEDFLNLKENSVFYDIGCYDGSTTKKYFEIVSDDCFAYYFEPSSKNQKIIEKNLSNLKNIFECKFGLSNQNFNSFFSENGSQSKLDKTGTSKISLRRLDDLNLGHPPTLIKIDIEGHELQALEGMQQTIKAHRPDLAIACYHYAEQILDVFELISSMECYEKISFRHYTESIYESVIFFYN